MTSGVVRMMALLDSSANEDVREESGIMLGFDVSMAALLVTTLSRYVVKLFREATVRS